MPRYRLLVYISGHGYGHVAQIAPILNQLAHGWMHAADIELIVCSAVSEVFLRSRIHVAFTYYQRSADFGMLMQSALEVDVASSIAAYLDFHADWDKRVEREMVWIAQSGADAVITNVAYLPLAAAKKLGLPALAMCSLNWADILRHYADVPELNHVQQQMRAAYLGAQSFLRLEPSMQMSWLNCHDVGPIADLVQDKRKLVLQRLGLETTDLHKLILVGMGGISTDINPLSFPVLPNVHWLLPQSWIQNTHRPDFHALEPLQEHFSILLASCDLVLTKPGYGTFVEAACHGIPVIYVSRDGWPEQDCLIAWLEEHGECREVDAAQLLSGDFAELVLDILVKTKPSSIKPIGNQSAARWIGEQLGLKTV